MEKKLMYTARHHFHSETDAQNIGSLISLFGNKIEIKYGNMSDLKNRTKVYLLN